MHNKFNERCHVSPKESGKEVTEESALLSSGVKFYRSKTIVSDVIVFECRVRLARCYGPSWSDNFESKRKVRVEEVFLSPP